MKMIAKMAMHELIVMASFKEPLWIPSMNGSTEILNEEEYLRLFSRGFGPKREDRRLEASRASAVVIMSPENLVEIFMDVEKWSTVFSSIVSNAVTHRVLGNGAAGGYDETLQLMSAKFHVPSPLGPTRKFLFMRSCKKHHDGMWSVADVSMQAAHIGIVQKSRRRPSGCLIQGMSYGYSKVTWVEHVEAAHDNDLKIMFKSLVNSGLAFSAKRWISTLECQCERLTSVRAAIIPNVGTGVIATLDAKRRLYKLADRMVTKFFSSVIVSGTARSTLFDIWAEDVHVVMHRCPEEFDDSFNVITVSTSFRLPQPPKQVFDYLRDITNRPKWDLLFEIVQEKTVIVTGGDHNNCISLINANGTTPEQNHLILQETRTEPTGSYIIYSLVNPFFLDAILNVNDINLPLESSGFVILPDSQFQSQAVDPIEEITAPNEVHGHIGEGGTSGSLLTVSLQLPVPLLGPTTESRNSLGTVCVIFAHIVQTMKETFSGENGAQ